MRRRTVGMLSATTLTPRRTRARIGLALASVIVLAAAAGLVFAVLFLWWTLWFTLRARGTLSPSKLLPMPRRFRGAR